jgi:tRNA pseudouridine32 synthase/23S rRNA pseudouridine746 synthase
LRRLRNEKFSPHSGGPPLHLHSRQIVVPISKNKPPVAVTAPVPAHMREALTACGWSGETNSVHSRASENPEPQAQTR